jgi:hypothetical protein
MDEVPQTVVQMVLSLVDVQNTDIYNKIITLQKHLSYIQGRCFFEA